MISHAEGEARVRALQKKFLCWVEAHPVMDNLDHQSFNAVRRQLYRTTFYVFKLGVVGYISEEDDGELWRAFFGWADHPQLAHLSDTGLGEFRIQCFRTALEVFRIGAQVEVKPREVQHEQPTP